MKRILTISIFTVSIFAIGLFAFMSFKETYNASMNDNYPFKDSPSLKLHESFSAEENRALLINLGNSNDIIFPHSSEYTFERFENFSVEVIKENNFYIDFISVYDNENLENTGNLKRDEFVFNDKIISDFDNFSSYEKVDDYEYRFYDLTPEIIKNTNATSSVIQYFENKNIGDTDSIESLNIDFGNTYMTTAEAEYLKSFYKNQPMGIKVFFYEHPLFDEAYLVKHTLAEALPLWGFVGFKKLDTPIEFYNLSDANSILNNETREEFKDAYTYQVFSIFPTYHTEKWEFFAELRLNKNSKDLFIDKNEMKKIIDSIQIK